MNLVGKIFVFLVFAMSVVFVTMSMAVFVTHRNWKDIVLNTDTSSGKTLGLTKQLTNLEDKNKALVDEKDALQRTLDIELARKRQALAALETELHERLKEVTGLQSQSAAIDKERRAALAGVETLTIRMAAMQKEIDGGGQAPGLRVMIAKLRTDRDQLYDKALRLTDEVNRAQGDVWRLGELKKTLEQQLAQSIGVLRAHSLNIDSPAPNEPPPPLNGLVKKVSKSGELIEVTIGHDDGLRKDHTMEVFNNQRYLGRMQVIETNPDSAVGRMLILRGRIQRGDRVATKIKVG
jgi:hypothetical protein